MRATHTFELADTFDDIFRRIAESHSESYAAGIVRARPFEAGITRQRDHAGVFPQRIGESERTFGLELEHGVSCHSASLG